MNTETSRSTLIFRHASRPQDTLNGHQHSNEMTTDAQQSVHNADYRLATGPVISSDAAHLTNGHLTPVDGPTEDDSTIKCICGFNDDDGNTVLCEDCNTWQHIVCYYPGADVPEVHQCVNCKPRAIDAKAATDRQKHTRFSSMTGERKQKRAPTKSHKKKNRDSISAIQLNGTTNGDKHSHDRNSGSPLEVPPAKRPKTSHRTSSSTTNLTQQAQANPTRRRTNSIAANRASPTKSPLNVNGFQRPNERFSLEFMQMYDKDYNETTTNSYSNLGTTGALSQWLDDSEEFEKVANGQTQHDVYMRWDNAWQDLEEMSPGVNLKRFEDTSTTAHGRHPVFHFLTAERDAGKGAFLGELTGQIAIRQDYEASSKMWPILRHPEPFVFFSDKLPICIDARNEGNKFRFIRRSCQPNSKMQIVIAGKSYRFCLVTEAPILADDEITLPWYIDPRIMDILRAIVDQKPISAEDREFRVKWISGILAHFGRCACNRPDDQCLLSLARTPRLQSQDLNGQSAKVARKKGKKHLSQISPSSTGHANNSRAGSEAVNQFDVSAEVADSPATLSGGPSKPSSRDISPTVAGADGAIGLGVDLSEREKRKIQEQERLFARLEQDDSKRRKRNSAGSTLNTPTMPHSSNLLADAVSPSPVTPAPSRLKTNGRSLTDLKQRGSSSNKSKEGRASSRSQREYFESPTPVDDSPEQNEAEKLLMRKRRALGCNYAQRMLIRSRRPRGGLILVKSASPKSAASPGNTPQATPSVAALSIKDLSPAKMEIDSPTKSSNTHMPPPPLPVHTVKDDKETQPDDSNKENAVVHDVEMTDAIDPVPSPPIEASRVMAPSKLELPAARPTVSTELKPASSDAPSDQLKSSNEVVSSLPSGGQAPASTEPTTSTAEAPAEPLPATAKPSLSVKLPLPDSKLALASAPADPASESAPNGNVTPSLEPPETPSIEKSPTMLKAVLTSSLAAGGSEPAAPSPPPRKKMSLSDWSSRNKKKKIEAAQQAAHSSPLVNNNNHNASEDALLQSPEEDKKPDLVAEEPKDAASSNNGSSILGSIVDEPAQVAVAEKASEPAEVSTEAKTDTGDTTAAPATEPEATIATGESAVPDTKAASDQATVTEAGTADTSAAV